MYLVRGRIDLWLENRGMKLATDGWWECGNERFRIEQLPEGIGDLACALIRPLAALRALQVPPLALAA